MAIEKIVGGIPPNGDKIGEAFNKVNNAFDEIITGATFNSSNSTLSLNKFDGNSFDVNITTNVNSASTGNYTINRSVNNNDVYIEVDLEITGNTSGDTITLIPQNFLDKSYFKLTNLLVLISRVDVANSDVGFLEFNNLVSFTGDTSIYIQSGNVGQYDYADDTNENLTLLPSSEPQYIDDSGSFTLPKISDAPITFYHGKNLFSITGAIKIIVKGFLI